MSEYVKSIQRITDEFNKRNRIDAHGWLKVNRCPWCKKRNQETCLYHVRETVGGGWKCAGYRSEWYEKVRNDGA